jgi:teichuronic acid biosynthesis glycosyltransferase TuaG
MTGTPIVSIVVPTYNQAALLNDALASIVAQTRGDWEVEVVDNNSRDDTQAVIAAFADPRIRVSTIDNRGIIAASRNQAIRHARGEWIAFLDSDDTWMAEKLALSLTAADANTDLVCHREHTVRDGQILRTSSRPDDSWPTYRNLLVKGNCFSPSAVMVRRNRLIDVGGFSEAPEIATCEDYDLWLKLAAQGARVKFIEPVLSTYRLHEANASASVERHMRAGLAVIDRHFAELKPRRAFDRLHHARRRAETIYGAGRAHFAAGDRARARACYLTAIAAYPALARPYAAMLMALVG